MLFACRGCKAHEAEAERAVAREGALLRELAELRKALTALADTRAQALLENAEYLRGRAKDGNGATESHGPRIRKNVFTTALAAGGHLPAEALQTMSDEEKRRRLDRAAGITLDGEPAA